jgi:type I restriction enzyme S subunit
VNDVKKTIIGLIPDDWKVKKIKDVCDTTSGGTPSRSKPEYYESGTIPWIKTGELNQKYIFDTEEKITEIAMQHSSAKLIPKNSVLMAMYGATIGKTSITKIEAATNQACCAMISKGEIEPEFLYYVLSFSKDKIISLGAGGAQPNISQQIIRELEIPFPLQGEQRKIAAILSSVDEAIEKTEAIIEQTEKVKKGLMQQLLTKGIGHTKFKKTEIGEIPEEWEVKSIDELVFVNPESLSNKTNEEYEFEYIDIGSVERTGKIGETVRYQFKNSPSRARRIVRTGDTIISTVRPYLRAFAFIDNKHDQKVCSTGFAVLRPKEKIDPVFLFQSILNDKFVEFLKSRMTGSNYPAVTATDIKEYKLGVPRDINEQTKIAKILAKYDEKLEIEEKSLEQLKCVKKALMQVLLTGKVRVKVDDEVMSQ